MTRQRRERDGAPNPWPALSVDPDLRRRTTTIHGVTGVRPRLRQPRYRLSAGADESASVGEAVEPSLAAACRIPQRSGVITWDTCTGTQVHWVHCKICSLDGPSRVARVWGGLDSRRSKTRVGRRREREAKSMRPAVTVRLIPRRLQQLSVRHCGDRLCLRSSVSLGSRLGTSVHWPSWPVGG